MLPSASKPAASFSSFFLPRATFGFHQNLLQQLTSRLWGREGKVGRLFDTFELRNNSKDRYKGRGTAERFGHIGTYKPYYGDLARRLELETVDGEG
ncbi:predicted protein [Chaetomium globosum CBS 148.51]|uniref:Uncharacterized protein n=1 Tax=Chaetomium globosum (strain ATCC 6205 / CBS 148.51 / DSM 1962 / NBRC 6347 / NRRL 1970) TaxID=306901 RepID=Q2GQV0_CHAGB|nr:uncharacterized protein CHGG_09654 [Chaetomium globosum CBS 148.51]EAQ83250.1 predicted protein [Chaetomium globosum CBS 148.51]